MCMDIFFTGYSSHEDQHTKLGDFRHYLISYIMLSCSNPLFPDHCHTKPPRVLCPRLADPASRSPLCSHCNKNHRRVKRNSPSWSKTCNFAAQFQGLVDSIGDTEIKHEPALFMHMQSHIPTKSCTTANPEA